MELNKNPFFSIVIPTKNRPNYVGESLRSVIYQNFDDYEVIVSDNYNDEQTYKSVEKYLTHPKVKYFRTDKELNMLDHWEFATRKATGKYVLLLADRKVLYQGSLKKLKNIIVRNSDINVFSFRVKVFDDIAKHYGYIHPTKPTTIFNSTQLIENFLQENIFTPNSLDFYFPKTLNGCYKNEFAQKVRAITGSYFNNKRVTTPDLSSFFINCALNDKAMYINLPVILTQGEQTSNGRIFSSGQYKHYIEKLAIDDLFRDVPIKAPFNYNLVTIDFIEIKKAFGGNLSKYNIDYINYFLTNYHELLLKKNLAVIDKVGIQFFEEEWEKGLLHMDQSIQKQVRAKINKIERNISKQAIFKISDFHHHLRDFINHRFSKYKIVNRIMKYRFENALQAARFKNF